MYNKQQNFSACKSDTSRSNQHSSKDPTQRDHSNCLKKTEFITFKNLNDGRRVATSERHKEWIDESEYQRSVQYFKSRGNQDYEEPTDYHPTPGDKKDLDDQRFSGLGIFEIRGLSMQEKAMYDKWKNEKKQELDTATNKRTVTQQNHCSHDNVFKQEIKTEVQNVSCKVTQMINMMNSNNSKFFERIDDFDDRLRAIEKEVSKTDRRVKHSFVETQGEFINLIDELNAREDFSKSQLSTLNQQVFCVRKQLEINGMLGLTDQEQQDLFKLQTDASEEQKQERDEKDATDTQVINTQISESKEQINTCANKKSSVDQLLIQEIMRDPEPIQIRKKKKFGRTIPSEIDDQVKTWSEERDHIFKRDGARSRDYDRKHHASSDEFMIPRSQKKRKRHESGHDSDRSLDPSGKNGGKRGRHD